MLRRTARVSAKLFLGGLLAAQFAIPTPTVASTATVVSNVAPAPARGVHLVVEKSPEVVDGRMVAAATEFEYACNPSATEWATHARWGSGTVLEARGCLRELADGTVKFHSHWRTRRGGTPIQSDWNLYPDTASRVHSYTTGFDYGYKGPGSFNDLFDQSYVQLANLPDCSQQAGNDNYIGSIWSVQVNPNGTTDGVSGLKSQLSASQQNSALDCGRQLW